MNPIYTKNLLRNLFFCFGVFALLSSCSKSDDTDVAAGISCTINGTDYKFNTNAAAMKNVTDDRESIAIYGYAGTAGASANLMIMLGAESTLQTGTYSDDPDSAPGPFIIGFISYIPDFGADAYLSLQGGAVTPTEIVITSITENSVQGTFKGLISVAAVPGTSSLTVTNGKFNVPILQ